MLHRLRPRWMIVNPAGKIAAEAVEMGMSRHEIARKLVDTYGIPFSRAEADVDIVCNDLDRKGFPDWKVLEESKRRIRVDSGYIHLTERCNLHCPHCYASGSDGKRNELPLDRLLSLIDELEAAGCNHLTLTGGEPLLHSRFETVLRYAASRMPVRLLTNATLLDDRWVEIVKETGISMQVSMDGSCAEIHDAVRGRGAFEKSLGALRKICEAGLADRLSICTTIMKRNMSDLTDIIHLGKSLGIRGVRFLPLLRCGRAGEQWEAISGMTLDDYERFFDLVAEIRREPDFSLSISCGLSGVLLHMPEAFADDEIWCPVGTMIVVDAVGDVYPCPIIMTESFRLGNILSRSIADILGDQPMRRVCDVLSRRRFDIPECNECSFKNLCQGGCMGQALDHKGTVWDTDFFCRYRKKSYRDTFDRLLSS